MKRFERSNGLDIALYKNYLYLFTYIKRHLLLNLNSIPHDVVTACRFGNGKEMRFEGGT